MRIWVICSLELWWWLLNNSSVKMFGDEFLFHPCLYCHFEGSLARKKFLYQLAHLFAQLWYRYELSAGFSTGVVMRKVGFSDSSVWKTGLSCQFLSCQNFWYRSHAHLVTYRARIVGRKMGVKSWHSDFKDLCTIKSPKQSGQKLGITASSSCTNGTSVLLVQCPRFSLASA